MQSSHTSREELSLFVGMGQLSATAGKGGSAVPPTPLPWSSGHSLCVPFPWENRSPGGAQGCCPSVPCSFCLSPHLCLELLLQTHPTLLLRKELEGCHGGQGRVLRALTRGFGKGTKTGGK